MLNFKFKLLNLNVQNNFAVELSSCFSSDPFLVDVSANGVGGGDEIGSVELLLVRSFTFDSNVQDSPEGVGRG